MRESSRVTNSWLSLLLSGLAKFCIRFTPIKIRLLKTYTKVSLIGCPKVWSMVPELAPLLEVQSSISSQKNRVET